MTEKRLAELEQIARSLSLAALDHDRGAEEACAEIRRCWRQIAELQAAGTREVERRRRYSTLQHRIVAWANSTAFAGETSGQKWLKLREEVEELGVEVRRVNRGAAGLELADVAIVLFQLAELELNGIDLFDAINEKMPANVIKHGGEWEG